MAFHIGSECQQYTLTLTITTLAYNWLTPATSRHSTLIDVNLSDTDGNRVTMTDCKPTFNGVFFYVFKVEMTLNAIREDLANFLKKAGQSWSYPQLDRCWDPFMDDPTDSNVRTLLTLHHFTRSNRCNELTSRTRSYCFRIAIN